jgi:hypothetical protein
MDGTISIMQYNCGQANYRATRPLLDAVSPATHAVLAIQEPAYSKRTCTTYCPAGYNLAYEACPETRVRFMVSKQIHVSNWSHQARGPYVATLCVQTSRGPLHIVNVYNPRGNGPRIRVWDSVQRGVGRPIRQGSSPRRLQRPPPRVGRTARRRRTAGGAPTPRDGPTGAKATHPGRRDHLEKGETRECDRLDPCLRRRPIHATLVWPKGRVGRHARPPTD